MPESTTSSNLEVLGDDGFLYVEVPMILEGNTPAPAYKSEEAACADLVALLEPNLVGGVNINSKLSLQFRASARCRTGVKVAVPRGYKLCVAARSGFADRGLIVANAPGQVDSDYRGEIQILLLNLGREIIEIKNGERVAQCWLERVIRMKPKIVTELPPSGRGDGAFGSTGVK